MYNIWIGKMKRKTIVSGEWKALRLILSYYNYIRNFKRSSSKLLGVIYYWVNYHEKMTHFNTGNNWSSYKWYITELEIKY